MYSYENMWVLHTHLHKPSHLPIIINFTLYQTERTFCWQEGVSEQSRHLESNTNTDVWLLNVTLSLDTINIHVMLVHLISINSMEKGISH